MPFTYISFGEVKNQVAQRLGDPEFVFWSSEEIGLYIKEALQVWNCAANYFIESGNFSTVAGTAFYDLSAELPALLGNTTTDQQTIQQMEYQLLESVNSTWPDWAGTEQFSMEDLVNALQRRRNQFLEDTGIYIGLPDEFAVDISQQGLVQLDDTVMQVRRVAWKAPDSSGNIDATQGNYSQLPRTDLFGANAQMPGWSYTPSTPIQYMPYYVTPPTTIQLAPLPIDVGRLHLVSVKSGADLDVSTGVVLGLDDDFIPYVRYGALADLLNMEGMAADPIRQQYCEQRYREGVELGKLTFSAVQISINGVPVPLMAFDDFDNQIAGWQNDSGQPTEASLGNSTLMALHPVPDDVYSVMVDAVRNAELPSADGDFVQVGREFLNVIIGYSVHAACFKLGGQEFQATMPLYVGLFQEAATFNRILKASQSNFDVLSDSSNREQQLRPAMAA